MEFLHCMLNVDNIDEEHFTFEPFYTPIYIAPNTQFTLSELPDDNAVIIKCDIKK